MLNKIKENIWLIGFISGILGLSVYLISYGQKKENIENRIFDSSEQKIEVVSFVENSLTPAELKIQYVLDTVNQNHAKRIRQQRYDDNKRKDSIRAIQDSLFLDMVKRQTVQIEQLKEEFKNR